MKSPFARPMPTFRFLETLHLGSAINSTFPAVRFSYSRTISGLPSVESSITMTWIGGWVWLRAESIAWAMYCRQFQEVMIALTVGAGMRNMIGDLAPDFRSHAWEGVVF